MDSICRHHNDVNPCLIYEKLFEATMANNTNLQIAAKNKTISEYDYKLVKSRSYPYLNFNGGYEYTFNTFEQRTAKIRS